MVALTDAVAQPGAMVVEAADTATALVAVLGPEGLLHMAESAVAAGTGLRPCLHLQQGRLSLRLRCRQLLEGGKMVPGKGSVLLPLTAMAAWEGYLASVGGGLASLRELEFRLGQVAGVHAASREVEQLSQGKKADHENEERRVLLP